MKIFQARIHLRAILLGASALHILPHNSIKGADTHASLTVSCESIVARKFVAAVARIWLDACVNLGVSLEIVLTNKALPAGWALILAVVQMGLNVGLDVFFATKLFSTVVKQTSPLAIRRLWSLDELSNLFASDACVGSRFLDIDIGDASRAGNACCGFGATMTVGAADGSIQAAVLVIELRLRRLSSISALDYRSHLRSV